MKVEYWNAAYRGAKSELVRTEDSFVKFYDLNNRLKYCNGSHYIIVDKDVNEKYIKEFFPKHHTIDNYYKGGIVD